MNQLAMTAILRWIERMKKRFLFSLVFSLGCCFSQILQAEGPATFHLAIDRLSPKTGDETEKTIKVFKSFSLTNIFKGQPSVSNWSSSIDLKFKENILIWDESNDYAKVEMVVDHCYSSNENKTNEPFRPGVQLVGTLIAGEWFVRSVDGKLSDQAATIFDLAYSIHPRHGIKGMGYLKLDQPRSVGERWRIFPDLSQLQKLNDSFGNFAQLLAKGLNTNNYEMTAQFIGITNIFGSRCFDLGLTINLKTDVGKPIKKAHVFAINETHFIMPFDAAQTFWMMNKSADMLFSFENENNGTNIVSAWGNSSGKIIITCRNVTQK